MDEALAVSLQLKPEDGAFEAIDNLWNVLRVVELNAELDHLLHSRVDEPDLVCVDRPGNTHLNVFRSILHQSKPFLKTIFFTTVQF